MARGMFRGGHARPTFDTAVEFIPVNQTPDERSGGHAVPYVFGIGEPARFRYIATTTSEWVVPALPPLNIETDWATNTTNADRLGVDGKQVWKALWNARRTSAADIEDPPNDSGSIQSDDLSSLPVCSADTPFLWVSRRDGTVADISPEGWSVPVLQCGILYADVKDVAAKESVVGEVNVATRTKSLIFAQASLRTLLDADTSLAKDWKVKINGREMEITGVVDGWTQNLYSRLTVEDRR